MKKLIALAAFIALFVGCKKNEPAPPADKTPAAVELKGISLSEEAITLEKGGSKPLSVIFTPADATDKPAVTWLSNNPAVATVSDGIVTGVGAGQADISAKAGNFHASCKVTVVISAASVSLDQTELTLSPGETATLKATVLPEDATDEVEWSSSDETVATVKDGEVTAVVQGEATITVKAGDQSATCSVKVEFKMKAIDLGLPSGLKWADCNLGAAKPEDYGDYYAWGEVEPYYSSQDPLTWKEGKTGYDWASYKWCNGDNNKLTKYCPADKADYWDGEGPLDGKTVLDPEDDAAHVILGGKWRMPTDAEWTALREECTWTWTTQNGVNGRLVTGKNGNSIFLPAAGGRYNTDLGYDSSSGFYWSSSLSTDGPAKAWRMYFRSGTVYKDDRLRFNGYSIRPVTE